MFRPRHAYKSPIINRYKGKAKGCPVFNNITDINSTMVEQHDECLECLAKVKNRTDLYKTLEDNNKPSNNVIKSLQKLSSSASNNRLKTCLQFLIIKVNEKTSLNQTIAQQQNQTTSSTQATKLNSSSGSTSPRSTNNELADDANDQIQINSEHQRTVVTNCKLHDRKPKFNNQQQRRRHSKQQRHKQKQEHQQQQLNRQQQNQLASPPQDQVSSTQDQVSSIGLQHARDDHDCQTSPMILISTQVLNEHDEDIDSIIRNNNHHSYNRKKQLQYSPKAQQATASTTTTTKEEDDDDDYADDYNGLSNNSIAQTQSSPSPSYALATTTTTTTKSTSSSNNTTIKANKTKTMKSAATTTDSTNASPVHLKTSPSHATTESTTIVSGINFASTTLIGNNAVNKKNIGDNNRTTTATTTTTNSGTSIHHMNTDSVASSKRRKIHNSSDHDTSSTASWSSSYASPPSPISTSSVSSPVTSRTSCHLIAHDESSSSAASCSSPASSSASASASTTSSLSSGSSPSPFPSPTTTPDLVNELRRPRLKLSEGKIRKIKKRPILFEDIYYMNEQSFASTPTTSSGCSPGQHSNTTQNSDLSRSGGGLSILTTNLNPSNVHMFQAPPKFVNNLKPCNLPLKQEPSPSSSMSSTSGSSATTVPKLKDMINCAICGIKARPPNISKIFGQNSCILCADFFTTFLKHPQQLYCAQDGDCLMTFDSRCQACWIKICLQKFDIEEKHRKVGQDYSPKLLSSPNVSLITIDTSLSR